MSAEIPVPEAGRLATNILHFARALRAAGVPVGPARVVEAIRAVEATGLGARADVYHTLAACLISRQEHRAIFDQCFQMFWRDPKLLEAAMGLLLPEIRAPMPERERRAAERRAAQALTSGTTRPPEVPPEEAEIEVDASLTMSASERLRRRDFEQMTAEELAEAKRLIAGLSLGVPPLLSRRTRPDARGRLVDWRATLRAALRRGGEIRAVERRARRLRWPALVAICDISGSMAGYSRMLLHFLHAAANAKGAGWSRVHAFTFGTELTNITRHLRHRDVDEALAAAGQEAGDWEGGTRIGASLEAFNRQWSRRVLGQGAMVLLITDGLDRDDPERLSRAAARLRLSARSLIWLNPLLRWDGFEARAQGVRALLPHVDSLRAAHSIASLSELGAALSRADPGAKTRLLSGTD